jgi:uncharacterized protein
MGSADDVEVIRRGYAAFSAGDMATLNELFTEDAVWLVPASGALSGTKQGRDGILSFFGELMSRSGGTLTVALDDVVGGETHTVAMNRNQATRGSETLQQDAVIVFVLRDGGVAEARQSSMTRPVTTRSGASYFVVSRAQHGRLRGTARGTRA